jgi:hypothetical protein
MKNSVINMTIYTGNIYYGDYDHNLFSTHTISVGKVSVVKTDFPAYNFRYGVARFYLVIGSIVVWSASNILNPKGSSFGIESFHSETTRGDLLTSEETTDCVLD